MAVIGKKIDTFPQMLKGLCILCVVLIHLPLGQSGEWTAWIWIATRKIINFAVAGFFFLSAYYTKPYNTLKSYGILNYYKKRLIRILVPYVIWASVYIFVIPFITTGRIENDWLFYFLTGKGPTYFLLALTQFTLLNPLLQKYKYSRIPNIIFIIITPAYLVFYYGYNFSMQVEFKPEQFFCFPWFACYYLGLKMQDMRFSGKINLVSPLLFITLTILILVISIIEASFIYNVTGIFSFSISQITIGSILYSLIILLLFKNIWYITGNNHEQPNILSRIGDYAMGIFLMHPTFNWIYKFVFLHTPPLYEFYHRPSGFIFVHLSIFVLSVISSYHTSKLLAIKFPYLTKPLGLK